ncbi:MAG: flagellar motor switch protein FliM [Bacillus sp. (in: Bacteria)]|nr:flagellar motor switch protein FliM [Bacillus sp. (in: firmicutes)]
MVDSLLGENSNAILTAEKDTEGYKADGGGKAKKVHTYDFKKALRFSQDQIRTITRIHENHVRLLTSYFSTQLRTFVQISVQSVEQCPYEEFLRRVEKKSILGVFKAAPLQGTMVMEFSAAFANVMFDRLLGGQGKLTNTNDELTEIELSIIERVFKKSLASFGEAWSSVDKLDPVLKEIELNPQFLTIAPPNETVILVSLTTTIGKEQGSINICLPHVVLEQILPKLTAKHWLANQKKTIAAHDVEELEKKLQQAKLDVKAILGQTKIDLGDFLNLKKGDVVRLSETCDAPVMIMVDKKLKF